VVSRIVVPVDGGPRGHDPLRMVDYVPGTVALIRGASLHAVGLFDEAYFFGGELADFCARARRQGYGSAVDARTLATHRLDRSSHLRRTLHAYYILRNRFLYTRKFHARHRRSFDAGWTIYGAGLVVLNLLRGRWPTARAQALGLMDGLRGRFGGQNDRILA
jgi:GT2 family glycosyltransferase